MAQRDERAWDLSLEGVFSPVARRRGDTSSTQGDCTGPGPRMGRASASVRSATCESVEAGGRREGAEC